MRNKLSDLIIKKSLLFVLAVFSLCSNSLFAQSIEGGAGVVFVDADPNTITILEDVTANEANIAYNRTTRIMYVFDPAGTAGVDQWIAVDVTSAVTDVTGSGDITVTQTGTTYNVDFTETHTTLSFDSDTKVLTYNHEDGSQTINLTDVLEFDDTSTIEQVPGGDGTTANPYTFRLVGSDTATDGQMPVSDGSGGLTWETVVQSATFLATGELELTMTDGSRVLVDMTNVPTISDQAELTTRAAAVAATGGIAKAAVNNTFGMPATANGAVLFLIQN